MADPFFSELKYLGNRALDFIEVAVDAGTDVSNFEVTVYRSNGTVRSTNSLGTLVATEFGKDIYVIDDATSATFNGLGLSQAVSLSDNGTLLTNNGQPLFFSFDDAAPVTAIAGAASGLTSTQVGQAGAGESLEITDLNNPTTFSTTATPGGGTIPCFAKGVNIQTVTGLRAVETLQVGDLVQTFDHGYQPIRWVGSNIGRDKNDAPISVPSQTGTIDVSPNHRILLSGPTVELCFGDYEVLAQAKHLYPVAPHTNGQTEYYHLLFDNHEIISADGVAAESLFLGDFLSEQLEKTAIRSLRWTTGWSKQDHRWQTKAARPLLAKFEVEALKKAGSGWHIENGRALKDAPAISNLRCAA
ncbi:MAG: Hint domain-containing protein [Pikeienuella sp.]